MLNTSNFLGITITWFNHLFKYMVVCQDLAFLPFLFPSNQSVFSVFSTKSLSATLYSLTAESEGWILVKPLLGRNQPYHAYYIQFHTQINMCLLNEQDWIAVQKYISSFQVFF